MNLKEALARIESLEKRVREFEARPVVETHHHYHTSQPVFQPFHQVNPPLRPYDVWCTYTSPITA